MKLIIIALSFLLFGGCTHSLHLANVSEFSPTFAPREKSTPVKSESSQFVILGFTQETKYVDKAYRDLANQCPNGKVQGIFTEYITDHGFFSWTNRVRMQGQCVRL